MKTRHTVLAIAPHPDDETLGCGGVLLRHHAEGDAIHWLVVTAITPALGFPPERVAARRQELLAVADRYGFSSVSELCLPATRLDTLPKGDIVAALGNVFRQVQPDTVYVPYRNDAHSDHAAVFDAAAACCKGFRHGYVKRVYAYETLSETEFGLRPDDGGFRPNLFVDTSATFEEKLAIMRLYAGEMGPFPFPRSEECLRAQAVLRGSQAGCRAAEAFMILKEIR